MSQKGNIGEGAFSKVELFERGNEICAKKIFHNCEITDNGIPYEIIREISVLKKVSSPYIISLIDIDYNNFEYIILPLFATDLVGFLEKNILKEYQIKNIFFQICSGIHSLHSTGIIHRDIKLGNICLSHNKYCDDIKVVCIDNGYSRKLDYDRSHGERSPKPGTIRYQSPELLSRWGKYSYEIDIWGAGCVLAEMHLRSNLFPDSSDVNLLINQVKLTGTPKKITIKFMECLPYFPGEMEKYFWKYGEKMFDLISGMLEFDPFKRYSISECLNSSYFDEMNTKIEIGKNKDIYQNYLNNYRNIDVEPKVNPQWRRLLVSWMFEICSEDDVNKSTFFTAVNLLDIFTTDFEIEREKYQLIGTSCLLIASKLESVTFFSASKLAYLSYQEKNNILEMEATILRKCEFNIILPNLSDFTKSEKYDPYLVICTLQIDYLKYKPSTLAAVCKSIQKNEISIYYDCVEEVKSWIEKYNQKPIESIQKLFK